METVHRARVLAASENLSGNVRPPLYPGTAGETGMEAAAFNSRSFTPPDPFHSRFSSRLIFRLPQLPPPSRHPAVLLSLTLSCLILIRFSSFSRAEARQFKISFTRRRDVSLFAKLRNYFANFFI
ncbi:hypothetical protein PUN28_005720 [Cardiocondyla obscurior]|uniref:Transmembrane protein n=1 Tax=Cardiocondyla obscurior TaxID=286306 RepID=A0AAW2G5C1_9HYME